MVWTNGVALKSANICSSGESSLCRPILMNSTRESLDKKYCDDALSTEPLSRTSALKEMIEYMKSPEGVWFATGIEIAKWWLKQNFSQKK